MAQNPFSFVRFVTSNTETRHSVIYCTFQIAL
jgi:hypothetical protein